MLNNMITLCVKSLESPIFHEGLQCEKRENIAYVIPLQNKISIPQRKTRLVSIWANACAMSVSVCKSKLLLCVLGVCVFISLSLSLTRRVKRCSSIFTDCLPTSIISIKEKVDNFRVTLSTRDVERSPTVLVFQTKGSSSTHENFDHSLIVLGAGKHERSPIKGIKETSHTKRMLIDRDKLYIFWINSHLWKTIAVVWALADHTHLHTFA